jgi:hypothetical protein
MKDVLKEMPKACALPAARRSLQQHYDMNGLEKRQIPNSCSELARQFSSTVSNNGVIENAINEAVDDLVAEYFSETGNVNGAKELLELGRTISFYVGGTVDAVTLAVAEAPAASIATAGIIATLFVVIQQGSKSGINNFLDELWKLALPKPFLADKNNQPKPVESDKDDKDEDDKNKCPLKEDAPVSF